MESEQTQRPLATLLNDCCLIRFLGGFSQRESECSTFAQRASNINGLIVRLYDMFNNRQTQTGTATVS